MKSFFDPSPPIFFPQDLITSLTRREKEALYLPERVIFTFDRRYMEYIRRKARGSIIESWKPVRKIYRIKGSNTIVTSTFFGGPNVAMLVEELSTFGVTEFLLLGFCGGLEGEIGDVILAKGAVREEGTSYHYMDDTNNIVHSEWAQEWIFLARTHGIKDGLVLSIDAPYRETKEKIKRYRQMGIKAVDMEVASFYGVCKFKSLKGVAFLVVSDLLKEKWTPGFYLSSFRKGIDKLTDFILRFGIKGP